MKWKVISSERVLNTPWMPIRKDVVELPDGAILNDYYVWESGDVALVVPVTESGQFIMVEQYKHAIGEITLEFPAGLIEVSESPESAAKRELMEETGYLTETCSRLVMACDNPTKSSGNLHIFLGTGARFVSAPKLDSSENIKIKILSREELIAQIMSGRVRVSGSIAAAFLAFNAIDSGLIL
jgi:8-oxo-dGTP pyrophosphatase MutT (NUDIX family)